MVDEKERSKRIWRNATICLVISLLASPLPTFVIGFIIGFAFTCFAAFHAWVSKCRNAENLLFFRHCLALSRSALQRPSMDSGE